MGEYLFDKYSRFPNYRTTGRQKEPGKFAVQIRLRYGPTEIVRQVKLAIPIANSDLSHGTACGPLGITRCDPRATKKRPTYKR